MVEIHVRGDEVEVEVLGLHRLWALKGSLRVPLSAVRGARVDPEAARGWWKGIRAPGTHVPGLIVAGTYYRNGERTFYDVVHAERAVVVELEGQRYDRLVVEVADPEETVRRLRAAAGRTRKGRCG